MCRTQRAPSFGEQRSVSQGLLLLLLLGLLLANLLGGGGGGEHDGIAGGGCCGAFISRVARWSRGTVARWSRGTDLSFDGLTHATRELISNQNERAHSHVQLPAARGAVARALLFSFQLARLDVPRLACGEPRSENPHDQEPDSRVRHFPFVVSLCVTGAGPYLSGLRGPRK